MSIFVYNRCALLQGSHSVEVFFAIQIKRHSTGGMPRLKDSEKQRSAHQVNRRPSPRTSHPALVSHRSMSPSSAPLARPCIASDLRAAELPSAVAAPALLPPSSPPSRLLSKSSSPSPSPSPPATYPALWSLPVDRGRTTRRDHSPVSVSSPADSSQPRTASKPDHTKRPTSPSGSDSDRSGGGAAGSPEHGQRPQNEVGIVDRILEDSTAETA